MADGRTQLCPQENTGNLSKLMLIQFHSPHSPTRTFILKSLPLEGNSRTLAWPAFLSVANAPGPAAFMPSVLQEYSPQIILSDVIGYVQPQRCADSNPLEPVTIPWFGKETLQVSELRVLRWRLSWIVHMGPKCPCSVLKGEAEGCVTAREQKGGDHWAAGCGEGEGLEPGSLRS